MKKLEITLTVHMTESNHDRVRALMDEAYAIQMEINTEVAAPVADTPEPVTKIATSAKKKTQSKKSEPVENTEPATIVDPEPVIEIPTLSDLRVVASQLIQKGLQDKVRAILEANGAAKLPELAQETYTKVMAELKAALPGGN